MSDYEEKRRILAESLKLLTGHEPFLRFMDGLQELREAAVRDACRNDVVDNTGRVFAALGEIRAYTDIQNLVSEYAQKPLDE